MEHVTLNDVKDVLKRYTMTNALTRAEDRAVTTIESSIHTLEHIQGLLESIKELKKDN